MRRLGTAFIWLEHVRHRTRSDVLEFVILLLGIPVFEASHFCFKRAYAISLRRIRLAGLDRLFEGLQHDTLKLDGLGSKHLSVAHTYHRLREIERRRKTCQGGGNLS
jgi:hypothetical protein